MAFESNNSGKQPSQCVDRIDWGDGRTGEYLRVQGEKLSPYARNQYPKGTDHFPLNESKFNMIDFQHGDRSFTLYPPGDIYEHTKKAWLDHRVEPGTDEYKELVDYMNKKNEELKNIPSCYDK
jgi:hypothetical protein